MQVELKDAIGKRLDKYISRETIAMVIGAFSLLESQAGPDLWAIFSLVALAILRGAKAFEKIAEYKHKPSTTEKVESIKDTQDTPTEKPEF